MTYDNISFTTEKDIGVLTLQRPRVLNAFNIPMAREIETLSAELRQRPAVNALIITGGGRAFSVGGDLSSYSRPREEMKAQSLEITGLLHAAIVNFARMDIPVIAAVNGIAAGAGFALACACDLAVASDTASFTAAYSLAGLCPDLGLSYTLPRLVGLRTARALILSNRRVNADEARSLGLVDQIVSPGELMAAAQGLCAEILKGSRAAIGVTKRLLLDGQSRTLESQLEEESELLSALSETEDAYERCHRFVK